MTDVRFFLYLIMHGQERCWLKGGGSIRITSISLPLSASPILSIFLTYQRCSSCLDFPEQHASLYIHSKTEIPIWKLAVSCAFPIATSVLATEKYKLCVSPLDCLVTPLESKMHLWVWRTRLCETQHWGLVAMVYEAPIPLRNTSRMPYSVRIISKLKADNGRATVEREM